MYLIDSNIIIYSYLSEFGYLRDLLLKDSVFISEISRAEVLGYHKLTNDEDLYFSRIFFDIPIIFLPQQVFDAAIALRKLYNMKLGDSIIAATAIVHNLDIYSRNIKDFERIKNLRCFDPIS